MDLSQAEAVADLISSSNQASHRLALSQLKGHVRTALETLRERLLRLTSLLELELDFSDHDDLVFADRSELLSLARSIEDHVAALARTYHIGKAVKEGIPVAIVGKTNVGKSTLLNHLVGEDRALVSDVHGTTRDSIEETTLIGGLTFRFVDTAGLRHTDDVVEQMGIERTWQKLDEALLVLWVVDRWPTQEETDEMVAHCQGKHVLLVFNKADLHTPPTTPLVADGGDTGAARSLPPHPISAKTGMGIDNLLEMVVLTAEMRELKANPNRSAHGAVIEARLDKGRGPIATLLVQNGTLHQGDVIIAGTAVGRVRAMTNAKGQKIQTAGPSVPVEITGMGEVPGAGDDFHAVDDERMARELVEQRKHEHKMAASAATQKVTLDDLFSQIQQGELKDLNIIVKADVQGSAEAVKASLEKLTNEEVRVRVIHCAVGAINESDVMLATTSNAIIVGFNVRPDANAKDTAARNKVDMRMYRVIYDCINEMEAAMKGMLAPKFKEVALGTAEVREVYKITGVGIVAGCYITDGKVQRNAQVRLVRDGIVIHEGVLSSLQRFKDAVKEVAQGYECGVTLEKFSDIKEGDIFEAYILEEYRD